MQAQVLLLYLVFPSLLFASDNKPDSIPLIYKHPKREYSIAIATKIPVGSFGDDYHYSSSNDAARSLSNSIQGNAGGMGAKIGYEFSFSGYYYFHKNPVQTVGGMKITYLSYCSIPFEWKKSGYVFDGANYNNFRFLSFKIGPAIRIFAGKNTSVHIYSQLILSHAWNGSWKNNLSSVTYDEYNNRYKTADNSEFKMNSGNGIRNETGISIRFMRILLEVSYSFGNLKFKNVHFERNIAISVEEYHSSSQTYSYYGSDSDQTTTAIEAKMPTGMLGFSIGYIFGK